VQHRDRHHGQPAKQSGRIKQGEERAGIHLVAVDGHALDQVGEDHPQQKSRQKAADRDGGIPGAAPFGAADLAAELEGHPAEDQRQQQQEKA